MKGNYQIISIQLDGKSYDSGFIMFPSGHANNKPANLEGILENKFQNLGKIAIKDENELKS
jgi:2-methylcitrate dehydratase